mgnify:CR=1 FL=1
MRAKERYDKRINDYILKLHDYGCTVEQIHKETRKSFLHINKMIERYRI